MRKLSNLLMIFSRGSYFSLPVRRLLMSTLRQMILRPRRVQGPLKGPPCSRAFLMIAIRRSGSQRADDRGKCEVDGERLWIERLISARWIERTDRTPRNGRGAFAIPSYAGTR